MENAEENETKQNETHFTGEMLRKMLPTILQPHLWEEGLFGPVCVT